VISIWSVWALFFRFLERLVLSFRRRCGAKKESRASSGVELSIVKSPLPSGGGGGASETFTSFGETGEANPTHRQFDLLRTEVNRSLSLQESRHRAEMDQLRASLASSGKALEPSPVASPVAAAEQDAPLPSGWEQIRSDDGRSYFHNKESRETSWVRPTPCV